MAYILPFIADFNICELLIIENEAKKNAT